MAEPAGDAAATRAFGPGGGPGLPRVLPTAPVGGLRAHEGQHGVPRLGGVALIGEVERSGLTGRGGAAFPAGRKLRSVRERAGLRGAVVIANGMESEPASAKDAALLARAPHLVLDGIALAAEATSARAAYLCVRRQAQADALAAAIAERVGYDPVPVELALVPEGYVSSAETSLVRYLNGGPALPAFSAQRPSEHGVRGRPTLAGNVETLANLALISRHGADWFRSVGTASAPGSALVTVSGAARYPGVYEIALGTPVRDVLELAGGSGEIGGVQAVLAETARVVRYLAGQSARQCGPCLNGLPAIADAFEQVAFSTGGGGRDAHGRALRWLRDLFGLVEGRGACHLPDGVARLAASALRVFADDVRAHQRGPCLAARGRPVFAVPSGPVRPAGTAMASAREARR